MKVVQHKCSLRVNDFIDVGPFELHSECIPLNLSERCAERDPSGFDALRESIFSGLQGTLISITNNF
jgi:hypothetical protein